MKFYIEWSDTPFDPELDTCQLGEFSFGNFWSAGGYNRFIEIIQLAACTDADTILDTSVIRDSNGKVYTAHEFFKSLQTKFVKQ